MRIRRAFLPLGVFLAVFAIHCTWTALFPDSPPEQTRWVAVAPASESAWLHRYIATQDYWLGFSYALPLSFAAAAFRRYREQRYCSSRTFAMGGVTVTGVLAVAGCFLVGCCGSPMLAVYTALLGASVLPMMKPLLAGVTTLTVTASWIWMNRESTRQMACCSGSNEHQGTDGSGSCGSGPKGVAGHG